MNLAIAQCALWIALGGVVDGSVSVDGRTAAVAAPPTATSRKGASSGSTVFTLGLRPALRIAFEREGSAIDASYSPQLLLVVPSQDLVLVLHTAALGAQWVLTPRALLRGRATLAVGDLDAGTAQQQLFNSLGVVDQNQALSYGNVVADVALVTQVSRLARVDVIARAAATGSPFSRRGSTTLRPAQNAATGVHVDYAWRRTDAAFFDAQATLAVLANDGTAADARAVGALLALGYRRQLWRGAALELRAGGYQGIGDAGDHRGQLWLVMPLLDARLSTTRTFSAGFALEFDALAGVTPTSDALGALVEDRLSAQAGVGVVFARDFSVRAAMVAATPLATFAPQTEAQAGGGASASIAWAFVDGAALQISAQAQSRLLPAVLYQAPRAQVDANVTLSITSTYNIWHLGGRPRGTDARLGRAVGTTGIGSAPPPQQPPTAAPEPLDPGDEATVPPELAAPPVNQPLNLDTPPPPKRRRPAAPQPADAAPDDDAGDPAAPSESP